MTAMLHCLVGDIADEFAPRCRAARSPANDEGNLALVEALIGCRLARPSLA